MVIVNAIDRFDVGGDQFTPIPVAVPLQPPSGGGALPDEPIFYGLFTDQVEGEEALMDPTDTVTLGAIEGQADYGVALTMDSAFTFNGGSFDWEGTLTFTGTGGMTIGMTLANGEFSGTFDFSAITGYMSIALTLVEAARVDDGTLLLPAGLADLGFNSEFDGASLTTLQTGDATVHIQANSDSNVHISIGQLSGGGIIDLDRLSLAVSSYSGSDAFRFYTNSADLLSDLSVNDFAPELTSLVLRTYGADAIRAFLDSDGIATGTANGYTSHVLGIDLLTTGMDAHFGTMQDYFEVTLSGGDAIRDSSATATVAQGATGTTYFGAGADTVTLSGGAVTADYGDLVLHGGADSDKLVLDGVTIEANAVIKGVSFEEIELSGATSGELNTATLAVLITGQERIVITYTESYTAGEVTVASMGATSLGAATMRTVDGVAFSVYSVAETEVLIQDGI